MAPEHSTGQRPGKTGLAGKRRFRKHRCPIRPVINTVESGSVGKGH